MSAYISGRADVVASPTEFFAVRQKETRRQHGEDEVGRHLQLRVEVEKEEEWKDGVIRAEEGGQRGSADAP